MILCWLQLHGFAVDKPFKISAHINAPFFPLSPPPPKVITNRVTTMAITSCVLEARVSLAASRCWAESPPAASTAAPALCFGM